MRASRKERSEELRLELRDELAGLDQALLEAALGLPRHHGVHEEQGGADESTARSALARKMRFESEDSIGGVRSRSAHGRSGRHREVHLGLAAVRHGDRLRLGIDGLVPHHDLVRPRRHAVDPEPALAVGDGEVGVREDEDERVMWAWMSQNTRTTPGLSNLTVFDLPVA